MVEDTLLVIDATGEEVGPRAALQEVIAAHLALPLAVVREVWETVGLVGGIENVTLTRVRPSNAKRLPPR